MFRERVQISRERLEYIYSIAVLIAIPLLVTANTLLIISFTRSNFDSELRAKASLANSLINETVREHIGAPDAMQAQVQRISAQEHELEYILVAVPLDGNRFRIIASSDPNTLETEFGNTQYLLTAERRQSIAQLLDPQKGPRVWEVASPVVDDSGRVAAVTVTGVSLARADSLIGDSLMRSLGMVCITVVVIVLLLVNHFRFVEYAILFRKLKEVDQLKSDFLSVATHELRSPMTVIKGNIETLREGLSGTVDDRGKEVLKRMSEETDRLNALVADLLNVSRIEQGKISYTLEVVDLREVTKRIVEQYAQKASAKQLALRYTVPDQALLVRVDKGRLIEILTNLIDNAIKYSREGEVVVSHQVGAGHIATSVRDTGIGMSAQARERLFTRYYRIQNEQTKGIPGTGLGLWIIKQYIERMHGTIAVNSMEGIGSEFIVTFPVAHPEDGAQSPADPQQ